MRSLTQSLWFRLARGLLLAAHTHEIFGETATNVMKFWVIGISGIPFYLAFRVHVRVTPR